MVGFHPSVSGPRLYTTLYNNILVKLKLWALDTKALCIQAATVTIEITCMPISHDNWTWNDLDKNTWKKIDSQCEWKRCQDSLDVKLDEVYAASSEADLVFNNIGRKLHISWMKEGVLWQPNIERPTNSEIKAWCPFLSFYKPVEGQQGHLEKL